MEPGISRMIERKCVIFGGWRPREKGGVKETNQVESIPVNNEESLWI